MIWFPDLHEKTELSRPEIDGGNTFIMHRLINRFLSMGSDHMER